MSLQFFVRGIPASQGSKRGFVGKNGRVRMVETSAKLAPWREAVRAEIQALDPRTISEAVEVRYVFYFQRPKSHLGAKGLRPSAPLFHITTPDTDKLCRSTNDALVMGGLLADDKLIVRQVAEKRYAADGQPSGVHVVVSLLDRMTGETQYAESVHDSV